jgi:hypothetical protein
MHRTPSTTLAVLITIALGYDGGSPSGGSPQVRAAPGARASHAADPLYRRVAVSALPTSIRHRALPVGSLAQ